MNNNRLNHLFLIVLLLLNLFMLNVNVVCAVDYYVDYFGGDDQNSGTSKELPWRTLQKINSLSVFKAGDKILLKRGVVWEDQLYFKSSGEIDNPIIIGAYGVGENPVIKCSTSFKNWHLEYDNGGKKIWRGVIDNCKWPMGAMKEGKRIEHNISADFSAMKDQNFYAPYNNRTFYYRDDSGNPGELEIGTRNFALQLESCKNIVIQSVDVFGPGGDSGFGSRHVGQLYLINCENVTVRNCVLSYGTEVGAVISGGSVKCIFDNIQSFGHESTGLYVSESGILGSPESRNVVRNCEVYDCGTLTTDDGDKGLIGVWQAPHTLVENCYVHDNGNSVIDKYDAAISFVQSPFGRVTRCKILNAASTALQFAEGSEGCQADYNIIDGWGVYGANMADGIRIGGGNTNSVVNNVKIYNNLFINGGKTQGWWAALRIEKYENKNLKVKNNIFFNNVGIYELIARSLSGFIGWQFSNNIYFKSSGEAIWFYGSTYDYNKIIGSSAGYYSFDKSQESASHSYVSTPEIDISGLNLKSNSPCVDNGVNVGIDKDFNGNSVPNGNGVDIGPFEYQASKAILPPTNLHNLGR